VDFGALLLPAALVFGAPESPDSYEKGLCCESVELVEYIVSFADRNPNARRLVADVNQRAGRNVCVYAVWPRVLARTVGLRKQVEADKTTYSIYEVVVTSKGVSTPDADDIEWLFVLPKTMYTPRMVGSAQSAGH
jgi:hypothetical protein